MDKRSSTRREVVNFGYNKIKGTLWIDQNFTRAILYFMNKRNRKAKVMIISTLIAKDESIS